MIEYYFNDELRWSYGFDNPNMAAALIASLLPVFWICVARFFRAANPALKWCGICAGSMVLCIGWWFLFKTYSRGGIAAGAAAFLYLGFCYRKTLPNHWRPVLLCGITILGLFISTKAATRSVQWIGTNEGSVKNRFAIWRGGLEMLAENPQGVGRGKSGEQYMQWYQPLAMTTHYRTLVNSYLTFATEQGIWIFGVAVFAGIAIWGAPGPQIETGFLKDTVMGARASLLAFSIAGFFSTTMENAKLWVVPAGCVAILIITTVFLWEWEWVSILRAGIGAFCICGLAYASGQWFVHSEILQVKLYDDPEELVVISSSNGSGEKNHPLLVVIDNEVSGPDYGKLLRSLAKSSHMQVWVSSSANFIQNMANIFAEGNGVKRIVNSKDKNLILVSPSKIEEAEAVQILRNCKSTKLLLPGFDEDGRVAFWKKIAENAERPNAITIQKLPGVGTRIEWAWQSVIENLSK